MAEDPIGRGRTAEIFQWGDGQILKLYLAWCPSEWADQEARMTRAVYEAGVPVPAVIDVIEHDGRRGIIFERVTGLSMLDDFRTKPWHLVHSARLLAELHAAMHARQIPDLPSLRQSLTYRINDTALADKLKSAALQALAQLPDGNAVCHGDFHPDNVILSPRGPIIIDWMTVNHGHPLADVARTVVILSVGEPPPGVPNRRLLMQGRDLFRALYLRRYEQLRRVTRTAIDAWLLPVAAARTREDIPNERQPLTALIESLARRYV